MRRFVKTISDHWRQATVAIVVGLLAACGNNLPSDEPYGKDIPDAAPSVPDCASLENRELVVAMFDEKSRPNVREEAVEELLRTGAINEDESVHEIKLSSCVAERKRLDASSKECWARYRYIWRTCMDRRGKWIRSDGECDVDQSEPLSCPQAKPLRAALSACEEARVRQQAQIEDLKQQSIRRTAQQAKMYLRNIRAAKVDPAVAKSWCEADLVIELSEQSTPSISRSIDYTLQPNSEGLLYVEGRIVR